MARCAPNSRFLLGKCTRFCGNREIYLFKGRSCDREFQNWRILFSADTRKCAQSGSQARISDSHLETQHGTMLLQLL